MKSITCPWCKKRLDSTLTAWEVASSNGRCPHCTRFYDPDKEEQVTALSNQPELRGRIMRIRMMAGFTGLLMVVPTVALLFVHLPHAIIGVAGSVTLSLLGFAAFYNSKSEARNTLMGGTNLMAIAAKLGQSPGPPEARNRRPDRS